MVVIFVQHSIIFCAGLRKPNRNLFLTLTLTLILLVLTLRLTLNLTLLTQLTLPY